MKPVIYWTNYGISVSSGMRCSWHSSSPGQPPSYFTTKDISRLSPDGSLVAVCSASTGEVNVHKLIWEQTQYEERVFSCPQMGVAPINVSWSPLLPLMAVLRENGKIFVYQTRKWW